VVKKQIEDMLRQVMVRTERLSVSTDQNGMVSDITVKKAQITAKDLTSFVTIDQIAQLLDLGDQTEYWKSAPYILNYMDSYILKKKFKQNFTACSNLATILERNRNALISWQQIEKYKKLDPQNYKLRDLISKNIDAGWQLLWIPPSLPYYQTNGIYACKEARNFTKSLVFSAWQVVPKVVSAICSYETERRMVKKYDESVPVQRKIYSYKELNKKHVQLLRFSNQEGRHTGMPVLTLLYPSLTLGKKVDLLSIIKDLSHLGSIPTIEEVSVAVSCKIQLLLEQANIFSYSNSSQEDERWYWASLALLERFYYQDQASQWQTYGVQKDNEYGAEPYLWRTIIKGRTQADEDSRFAEHVDHFYEAINNPDQLQLGSPPKDLINVLTKIAIASPAVTALRSLSRVFETNSTEDLFVMMSAAIIATGFRTLFNLPETIALIRGSDIKEPYWERVLEYCQEGNLQATLDEYIHILYESLGLMGKGSQAAAIPIADEIHAAVSIRTTSLDFDEIKLSSDDPFKKRSIRCRYAIRYGEGKNEDGEITREGQVRTAFNSPFRPFILTTTSVGQEGLDFHQYCHAIFHWNLPSNPVDLEQREGRIHRYKSHVIRKNLARHYGLTPANVSLNDVWKTLFDLAVKDRHSDANDLIPYWIFETKNGFTIERHIPLIPLCREEGQIMDLKKTLTLYRMVFGQPRQEDLANFLKREVSGQGYEDILKFRINLSPKALDEVQADKFALSTTAVGGVVDE